PAMFATIFTVGIVLGFALDATPNIPEPYGRISSVIGWTYFAAWSMSFWPQIISNFSRQSVVGVSLDYQLYNLLGFVSYTIFNCSFFWDTTVQADYMALHDGHRNAVQINDVFFALHALTATLVQAYQCLVYPCGDQTFSVLSQVVVGTSAATCALFYLVSLASSMSEGLFTTLNFLYLLSYVKLGATLVKYIPQVYLNHARRSTVGYSIYGVLVDFLGSILSIGQLVMDGAVTDDWSAISGDPVKFGLGAVCIFFDAVFMVQHYVLYPDTDEKHGLALVAQLSRSSSSTVIVQVADTEDDALLKHVVKPTSSYTFVAAADHTKNESVVMKKKKSSQSLRHLQEKIAQDPNVMEVLNKTLRGLDEALVDYMVSILSDYDGSDPLVDTIAPFLLSSGFTDDESEANRYCSSLQAAMQDAGLLATAADDTFKKLDVVQSMEDMSRATEAEMNGIMERMWGFENIRKTKNYSMDACANTQSQRQIRKEAKKELSELEKDKMDEDEDRMWEDTRVLPDMSTDNGEKDIHVDNVTMNFKGQTILSNTSLKLIFGRRYGLIGKVLCFFDPK
ncbi:hypothetical protein DYB34_013661, partial [Aphanomyces astaci]